MSNGVQADVHLNDLQSCWVAECSHAVEEHPRLIGARRHVVPLEQAVGRKQWLILLSGSTAASDGQPEHVVCSRAAPSC